MSLQKGSFLYLFISYLLSKNLPNINHWYFVSEGISIIEYLFSSNLVVLVVTLQLFCFSFSIQVLHQVEKGVADLWTFLHTRKSWIDWLICFRLKVWSLPSCSFRKQQQYSPTVSTTTTTRKSTGLGPMQIRGADLPTGRLTTNAWRSPFNGSTYSL